MTEATVLAGAPVNSVENAAPGIYAMLREDARCIFLRDPAGKAIGCLLDRIEVLEEEVRQLHGTHALPAPSQCGTCAAGELCCEEHRHHGGTPS